MPRDEIHQFDIGLAFTFTIKDGDDLVDISGMTLTDSVIFEKPDCSALLVKDGTFVTDGTDSLLRYTTISGDLSVAGTWRAQSFILIGGSEWHSDIITFKVHENLN